MSIREVRGAGIVQTLIPAFTQPVMVGLVPTIHLFTPEQPGTAPASMPSAQQDVDGRHKGDHDGSGVGALAGSWTARHPACMRRKGGWVYIVTNRPNGTLYLGVTSDLARRVHEHREGLLAGFTRTHGLKRLVWYEWHDEIEAAIQRETSMKRWYRAWKTRTIMACNPDWNDLYDELA
jgi:putative endonuclease